MSVEMTQPASSNLNVDVNTHVQNEPQSAAIIINVIVGI